jgi:hypothetical protein
MVAPQAGAPPLASCRSLSPGYKMKAYIPVLAALTADAVALSVIPSGYSSRFETINKSGVLARQER